MSIRPTSFDKIHKRKDELPPAGSPEMFFVTTRIGFGDWFLKDYTRFSIDGEGESYFNPGKNEGLDKNEIAFFFGQAHAEKMVYNFAAQAGIMLVETGFGYEFPTGGKIIFLPGETIVTGMEKADEGTKQFIKGVETGLAELKEQK